MAAVDERACKEAVERITDRIERNRERIIENTDRLNNHSERIKNLEQYRIRTEVQIDNLIEQVKNLVTTIRWFMGFTISLLAGFFIWYIQNLR